MGSSRLLINESPLQFQPTLAVHVGVNEAIFLQQLHYWLEINKKSGNENNFRDGRWWSYNTYEEWQENNFPFWSVSTIKRTVKSLSKIVISKKFDSSFGDQRKWYSIDYEVLNALYAASGQSEPIEQVNMNRRIGSSWSAASGQSEPIIYKDSETTSETTSEIKEIAEPKNTAQPIQAALELTGEESPFEQRAMKRGTTEQVLSKIPESAKTQFLEWWKHYCKFCKDRGVNSGAKKQAAEQWVYLTKSNFRNRGYEAFKEGYRLFRKRQGDSKAGIPHGCRFLFSSAKGSGPWEDILDQEEASKSLTANSAPKEFKAAPAANSSVWAPAPLELLRKKGAA